MKELLNDSLTVFKKLFVFNLLFSLVSSISAFLIFSRTILYFFTESISFPDQLLEIISHGFFYLIPLLSIFIVLTPFIIVTENLDVIKAIKKTINFIISFLFKYLTLVLIAIIFLALPAYVSSLLVLTLGIRSFSIMGQLLTIFVPITILFISIIVYISIFYFYYQNKDQVKRNLRL